MNAPHGPYDTEQQARAAALAAVSAQGQIILTRAQNRELLRSAITDAGVTTGAYDDRIIDWLGNVEDAICAVVAGLISRAAQGGAE